MRTRFVKGTITKTTGGNYKMYSNGNIINNAGGFIRETADNQITYGNPEDAPKKKLINSALLYETDGHYSTVYLVCLMLGMNEEDAEELAIATESPDTTIHSEIDFELNDTWADPDYQGSVHSLTGGFHGIEEFMTAVKILWLKINDKNREDCIRQLGELLHRFGDTYAHTKLDNIKPSNLTAYNLHLGDENLPKAIASWKGQGGKSLAKDVEPWIVRINEFTKKYGYSFLTNENYQREAFNGKTLTEEFQEIYLLKSTDKFKMYGGGYFTTEHLTIDSGYPDMIYIRPDWYLNYVKNLAWLLALKFKLDLQKFDISVFERMTKFATENKCSLKGIIDYEIAKKRGKREFFIPVFYSSPTRLAASGDSIAFTDYLQKAKEAKEFTIKYMMYEGNYPIPFDGEEITNLLNLKFSIKTENYFYYTDAYKLKF
ncbi:hypothetical protein [Flavobacterium johnsoniae]|uniref:hypothetical protein n=1 Tax=Flavobacterium johnsoniae TaxID=986 RepID=UPI0011EF7062|nr:hypothetical protein [Flavobacterium johnsoniae]